MTAITRLIAPALAALIAAACGQPISGGTKESGGSPSAALTAIQIARPPDMTLYPNPAPRLFDAFDPAGLAVKGAFADGSERLLAAEAYTFDRIPRPEWVGLKVITVRAKENPSLTAQFQIAVDTSDRVLESLSVANAKSAYFFGEPFDKSKLLVTGHFSDGEEADVSALCAISGYDYAKSGEQTVSAAVNGVRADFPVSLSFPADTELTPTAYTKTYIKGQPYDFAATRVSAKRSVNGKTVSAVLSAGSGISPSALSGYDGNAPGPQQISITIDAASASHYVGVVGIEPSVYFDYGYWRIPGVNNKGTYNDGPEEYTARLGRPLVLAPVLMLLGYGADHKPCGGTSYSWTVTGADGDYEASGEDTRYFTLTPKAEGSYRIRVSVTGRNYITGATDTKTAETTVVCGVKEYKGGFKVRSNYAPGQFTEGGNGYGWSLGAWGGYKVWYLGEGVPPRGNKAVKVEGNGFAGWHEPSDLWVSYDDNQNGLPDDTWYGVETHGSAQKTVIGRYAVTWLHGGNTYMGMAGTLQRQLYWADSKGRVGATDMGWPKDWGAPDAAGTHITYTGNLVCDDDRIDVGYYGGVSGDEECYLTASGVRQWNDTPAGFTEISFCRVYTSIFRYGGAFGEMSAEISYADGLGQMTDFPLP